MKINKVLIESEDIQTPEMEKAAEQHNQEVTDVAAQIDSYNKKSLKKEAGTLDRVLTSLYQENIQEQQKLWDRLEYLEAGGSKENAPKYMGPMNILISGPAGVGKSGIIADWADRHKVNLVTITGAELTPELIQGIGFKFTEVSTAFKRHSANKEKLENEQFDLNQELENPNISDDREQEIFNRLDEIDASIAKIQEKLDNEQNKMTSKLVTMDFFQKLSKPRSVLFIDEINRSKPNVRAVILDIIQSHKIPNSNKADNKEFLDNFLFTIAAQNPSVDKDGNDMSAVFGSEAVPLEAAMLTRFKGYDWYPNIIETREFLMHAYTNEANYYKSIIGSEDKRKARYDTHYGLDEYLTYKDAATLAQEALNKKEIARLVCSSQLITFVFDANYLAERTKAQDRTLNARTLTTAIEESHGDKEVFIKNFRAWCGVASGRNGVEYVNEVEGKLNGAVVTALKNFKPDQLNIANKGIKDGSSELNNMKNRGSADDFRKQFGVEKREQSKFDKFDKNVLDKFGDSE